MTPRNSTSERAGHFRQGQHYLHARWRGLAGRTHWQGSPAGLAGRAYSAGAWFAGTWFAGAWFAGAWFAGAWFAGAWFAGAGFTGGLSARGPATST